MNNVNLDELDKRDSWKFLIEVMYEGNIDSAILDCKDGMMRAFQERNLSLYTRLEEDFKILTDIRFDNKMSILKGLIDGE